MDTHTGDAGELSAEEQGRIRDTFNALLGEHRAQAKDLLRSLDRSLADLGRTGRDAGTSEPDVERNSQ